jgi:hypothetical protein
VGDVRNAYSILVKEPEGTRPLGRPRRRWKDIIKMDFREVGMDIVHWIHLVQNRDRWRALAKKVMNLLDP